MFVLEGPDREVRSLEFSADNSTVYAIHGYVGVHEWALATRTGRALCVDLGPVFGEFALAPNGLWALGRIPALMPIQPNHSRVIDLESGATAPANFSGVVGQSVAFSRAGTRLATRGHTDYEPQPPANVRENRLYLWNVTATGPEPLWHTDTPEAQGNPWNLAFLGNHALATFDWVIAGPRQFGNYPYKFRIARRALTNGAVEQTADMPSNMNQLLASPDGSQIVVRNGMRLWVRNANDLSQPPMEVLGSEHTRVESRAAAFDRSGRFLLLANNGPSVRVFDTATWREVRKWKWSAGTLRAVAVSPDGTLAAAGSTRGTVVVWDLDL